MSTAFRRFGKPNLPPLIVADSLRRAFVRTAALITAKFAVMSGLILVCSTSAQAQLTFFTDRTVFNSAAIGLVTEDFDEAILSGGAAAAMSNPLDAATNNTIFSTGDIVSGLRISVAEFNSSTVLGIFGTGFGGIVASKSVFGNNAFTSLNLSLLNGATTAVGFDLLTYSVGGPRTVRFYDSTDTLLGAGGCFRSDFRDVCRCHFQHPHCPRQYRQSIRSEYGRG
jgi:hypothetical protein